MNGDNCKYSHGPLDDETKLLLHQVRHKTSKLRGEDNNFFFQIFLTRINNFLVLRAIYEPMVSGNKLEGPVP